jgi:phosphoribosyl-ATP pyrophosphohydrolase/phosphoribosyl-AMP cyclohydrolase/histidinol dehydrogenase
VDAEALATAGAIVGDVRARGEVALREHAERLGDLAPGEPLVRTPAEMQLALELLDPADRAALERITDRIATFAEAQLSCVCDLTSSVPGGEAGHRLAPVERAGCYAPGGRFPLPSSVLMTAVTARTAGVGEVWVASPRPTGVTLAAAALADAKGLVAAGGAQAIAALAYGAGELPPCDAVVGPGNRWVTAAKQLVSGQVAIDMLAGPSELVVIADGDACPRLVAADLLAQAEHDPEALPVLVTTDAALADAVDAAIAEQLADLATADTARPSIAGGFTVVCADEDEALGVADRLAPEHLQLHTRRAEEHALRLKHYGGLFIGARAAEVLGDYGAGPNHTLPTGGTARSFAGLSVFTFLRPRTWLRIDDAEAARQMAEDAARLARMEGLAAHERAAQRRASGDVGRRPNGAGTEGADA